MTLIAGLPHLLVMYMIGNYICGWVLIIGCILFNVLPTHVLNALLDLNEDEGDRL